MSEVAIEPLARLVRRGDERLPLAPAPATDTPVELVVTASVAVFVAQSPEDMSGRVSMFTRRLLVGLEIPFDDPVERPQLRRVRVLGTGVRLWFGARHYLPDLPARMMQGPSDRPNAYTVTLDPANASVVFHREHPSPPDWPVFEEKKQHPEAGATWKPSTFVVATVGLFYVPTSQEISPPCVGPDCAPITTFQPASGSVPPGPSGGRPHRVTSRSAPVT